MAERRSIGGQPLDPDRPVRRCGGPGGALPRHLSRHPRWRSVRSIEVTPEAVVAELEINKGDLRLPRPVTATVGAGSLLGGDAQVALVSHGEPLPQDAPFPRGGDCQPTRQLCNGGTVVGREAPSLSTVTATMQELLAQVQDERVIPNVAASLEQIEATTKEFEALTVQLQDELAKAAPVIRNLEAANSRCDTCEQHRMPPSTIPRR